MAAPNAEEKIAIQKLRERVGDILSKEQLADDWFLIRWLRARDLNLEKTEAMLRNSMKWRAENNVDKIMDKPVDSYFSTNYPFNILGKDREGRPVVVVPIGKWDAKMAVDDGKTEQLLAYINYMFESTMKAIRAAGKNKEGNPHTQVTIVSDWDGYSFRQLTNMKAVQTLLKMAGTYEAHYPEILHQSFFINTTGVFQMLWGLMKKVLAEKTVGKIQVFGTKRKEWEPAIIKLVDPSQLHYELHEGHQLEEDEIQKMKDAKIISEDEIQALIVR